MALETVAIIETTGKGFSWLWKTLIIPQLNKGKRERREILDKIIAIDNKVGVIHKEVSYNGQSSLKDAVLRIENRMDLIDTRLYGIQQEQHVSMNLQGIAFWISNPDGDCVEASINLCKLLGRNETEIMGNAWMAWIIPEDKERVFDAWDFSVKHKSAFDEEYTFKKGDGKKQKVWGLAFHKKVGNIHAGTMGKLEAIGEPS